MKIWGIIGLVAIGIGGAACTTTDDDAGTGGTAGTGANGGTAGSGNGGTAGTSNGGTAGTSNGGTAGTSNGGTGGTGAGGTGGTGAGGSGGGGCTDEADLQSCGQCFCTEDQAGCGAYNTATDAFYCGDTCGSSDCSAYCADMTTAPDAACDTCANALDANSTEFAAFQAACQADADCVRFVTSLQTCPN